MMRIRFDIKLRVKVPWDLVMSVLVVLEQTSIVTALIPLCNWAQTPVKMLLCSNWKRGTEGGSKDDMTTHSRS